MIDGSSELDWSIYSFLRKSGLRTTIATRQGFFFRVPSGTVKLELFCGETKESEVTSAENAIFGFELGLEASFLV